LKKEKRKKREETSKAPFNDYLWRESLGKEKIFLSRKKALIDRDPLTKELLKELQEKSVEFRGHHT